MNTPSIPTISLIVPVYKAEKYLHRCVDSILAQTFTNFELILVDDGSPDNSGSICDEYATKDHRIRVYHKQNGGVSSARNLGIENAKGEWLLFIDSDDEIKENSLGELLENSNDTDLIITEPIHIFNDKVSKSPILQSCIFTPEQYAFYLLTEYNGQYQGYTHSKVFKRSIIINNDLRFDADIFYNEDRLFVMKYLCFCNIVDYSSFQYYMYYHRDDSAMGLNKIMVNYKSLSELHAFERMIICIKNSKFMQKKMLINHCNFGLLSSGNVLLSKCDKTNDGLKYEIKRIIDGNVSILNKVRYNVTHLIVKAKKIFH